MEEEKIKVEYFGYSRKSPDDKQGTETSIKNQNDMHSLICQKNNWNLNSIESDRNMSGGRIDRKGILLQIQRCKEFKKLNPETEVYLGVKDSKRFARNNSFFKEVWEDLDKENIRIFSISKNSFLDYSDIGDRVIGVVDEQIIYDAKKYAKLTQELKISQGLPCIPAPFGYKYDSSKNWTVVKKEADIIRSVVSDYLNKCDYKAILKDYKISKGVYYRILRNTKMGLYSGYVVFMNKGKETRYKGVHEAIISEELWRKVNESPNN